MNVIPSCVPWALSTSTWRDRWLRSAPEAVLLVSLVMIPAAWSYRTLDFSHTRLAWLCGFLVILALLRAIAPTPSEAGNHRATWIIGTLGLWMCLVSIGAIAYPHGFPMATERLTRAFPVLLYGWLAADWIAGSAAIRSLRAIVTSGVVITGLAMGQYTGLLLAWFPAYPNYAQPVYSVLGNQNFLGGYLAVCAAIAFGEATETYLVPHGKRTMGISGSLAAAGVLMAGVALSASRTAFLALTTAMAIALLRILPPQRSWRGFPSRVLFRRGLGLVLAGMVGLGLIAWGSGLISKLLHSFSGRDTGWWVRWWLWHGALTALAEHPFSGIGWNRYILESPSLLGEVLWRSTWSFQGNSLLADTAHSEPLQLLAETGFFGALPLVLIAGMLFLRVKPSPVVQPALAALGVFCLFNSPLKDPAFSLVGMVLLLASPEAPGEGNLSASQCAHGHALPRTCRIRLTLAAFAVISAVTAAWTHVLPGIYLRSALDAHTAGHPEAALADYDAACRHAAPSIRALALENMALALLDLNRDAEALAVTDRAIAMGWDTGQLYWIRALAAERSGAVLEAERSAAACLRRWPFHEPAWELLSRNAPAHRKPAWIRRREWWRQRHPLPSPGSANARDAGLKPPDSRAEYMDHRVPVTP